MLRARPAGAKPACSTTFAYRKSSLRSITRGLDRSIFETVKSNPATTGIQPPRLRFVPSGLLATVLLCTGRIDEPLVGHGPFVMISEVEIVQAIADFNNGYVEQTPLIILQCHCLALRNLSAARPSFLKGARYEYPGELQ
ncbi:MULTISPECIES: pirin-like C-terminal cupin domain-containing protein [unclassified Pseudomonas]|uniref:pirin-like C-terminal cupin domain-containing protein n=1 Tax=unclassified Pseudomonas TaxID=196821 RepID=UPI000BA2FE18